MPCCALVYCHQNCHFRINLLHRIVKMRRQLMPVFRPVDSLLSRKLNRFGLSLLVLWKSKVPESWLLRRMVLLMRDWRLS